MRINCHAHVFNLNSIFTTETIKILLRRLSREGWDPCVVEAASQLIKKAIGSNAYVDEEEIFQGFAMKLGESASFKQVVEDAGNAMPMEVRLIGTGGAANLGLSALKSALGKFSSFISRKETPEDVRASDLWDLIDFLRIALKPDIADVTDKIMEQIPGDDGIIALMMDITSDTQQDATLFEAQTAGTSQMVLEYPGRIFPFFAVNPKRSNYQTLMIDALSNRGFVGIKLYPSLGYKLDQLDDVFSYCIATDTPVMVHCNQGGFYARKPEINNGHPRHWKAILQQPKYRKLKICFGHFGGDENITKNPVQPSSWTQLIIDLMKPEYPGVYADISYHTDAMEDNISEANYFNNLTSWLQDETIRERILFGTDYFLVRRRLREESQWAYFRHMMAETTGSDAAFDQITIDNPANYLGLPKNTTDRGTVNIQNYVHFVVSHNNSLKRDAAKWLVDAARERYGEVFDLKGSLVAEGWDRNNQAHVATYKFFRFGKDGNEGYMYRSHYDLKFAGSSRLKLRQMRYWNKEHEDPVLFKRKCEALGRRFDDFLVTNGVLYEDGIMRASAEKELTELFEIGGKTLTDVAGTCSKLYKFSREQDDI